MDEIRTPAPVPSAASPVAAISLSKEVANRLAGITEASKNGEHDRAARLTTGLRQWYERRIDRAEKSGNGAKTARLRAELEHCSTMSIRDAASRLATLVSPDDRSQTQVSQPQQSPSPPAPSASVVATAGSDEAGTAAGAATEGVAESATDGGGHGPEMIPVTTGNQPNSFQNELTSSADAHGNEQRDKPLQVLAPPKLAVVKAPEMVPTSAFKPVVEPGKSKSPAAASIAIRATYTSKAISEFRKGVADYTANEDDDEDEEPPSAASTSPKAFESFAQGGNRRSSLLQSRVSAMMKDKRNTEIGAGIDEWVETARYGDVVSFLGTKYNERTSINATEECYLHGDLASGQVSVWHRRVCWIMVVSCAHASGRRY